MLKFTPQNIWFLNPTIHTFWDTIYMKNYFLFIIIYWNIHFCFSQDLDDIRVKVMPINPKKWDTTCYTSYSKKLNIYFGITKLSYNLDISSGFKHPYKYTPNINYASNMPNNYLIGFSYDKISLSIGISKKYTYDSTQTIPKTQYRAYSLSFGGNKFIIEPYYVQYKGFYDQNTPKNDTLFNKNHRYHINPSLEITSFKINSIYFLNNKRFAYRALSGYTYRQLKSKGSWLLMANAYYTHAKSDSSLFPKSVELAYDSVKKINAFKISGISIGGGYGYILALGKKKRFFLGFTVGLMLGIQQKEIYFKDSITSKNTVIAYANDLRFSMGWTTDKFFAVLNGFSDRVQIRYSKVIFMPYALPFNFMLGLRLNVKPPKFYRWFMNTKLYNLL